MTTVFPHPITVVTGGAGALGSATAAYFAERGDTVVIIDRDEALAQLRAEEISAYTGATVRSITADLNDPNQARQSIQDVTGEFGRLDRLVNNAAFNPKQSLASTDVDAWETTMGVNLRTPMILAQTALPTWKATGYGRVVNITSRTYLSGGPAAYVTSKAGLVGLTRSLALELGPLGVTVNAVAPSMIATPFTQGSRTDEEFAAFTAKHQSMSALGRLATVEDVVQAIGFLASDAASFITGEVLHVAGGAHLAAAP